MRVLVATTDLQGQTPGDYAHAVTGELVTAAIVQCHCTDCGCDRGFAGLTSQRATTTAMVVEHPHITTTDLREVVYDYLVSGGWLDLFSEVRDGQDDGEYDAAEAFDCSDDPDRMIQELIDEHLDVMAFVCNRFEPGTVISRSGDLVWSREWPTAA